jgi:hypothetical protein
VSARLPLRATAPLVRCAARPHGAALTACAPLQAEIKKKVADATTNKGGGSAGLADRKGGAAGHAKFKCPICSQQAPDLKVRARRGAARLAGGCCARRTDGCAAAPLASPTGCAAGLTDGLRCARRWRFITKRCVPASWASQLAH